MTASSGDVVLDVESLDLEANGVARHDGKVIFVRGALPGERVTARVVRRKPKFEVAETVSVLRPSSVRVVPRCPHFGVCGGCSMQHMDATVQVAVKQRVLEDQLWHLAKLRPQTMLRAMAGPAWGYRYRARLSVRHVPKKGGVLVGFHERGSSYVADMRECHVMPRRISDLLVPLRELIGALSIRDRLPQIEVAHGTRVLALVLRILAGLTDADRQRLREFARIHDVELWLQTGGPEAIELFCTGAAGPSDVPDSPDVQDAQDASPASSLAYSLPEFDLTMPFRPTDFTQVNHEINRLLVVRAVRLLAVQPGDRVADLFCGLGNFTLPLARAGAQVTGIEGSAALVRRATANAELNGLSAQARFSCANLFAMNTDRWRELGPFARVLIDPPREGALELVKAMVADPHRIRRIVYVSCNPATLARDAGLLVHEGGYRLESAGVVNMFPHTSHVESIACFDGAPP